MYVCNDENGHVEASTFDDGAASQPAGPLVGQPASQPTNHN